MRPLLLAAALAFAAAPVAAEKINLRDYWILAEIENPTTGEHASFRVDCTRGASTLCIGGAQHPQQMHRALAGWRARQRDDPRSPLGFETIMVAADPDIEGVVGFAIAGASGVGTRDLRQWFPLAMPWPTTLGARMDDLRSPEGMSRDLPTMRNTKVRLTSDVMLTMWLVTPAELAMRDADARRAPGAAGKAARKADRLKKRLEALAGRLPGLARSRGKERDRALERAAELVEALEKAVGRR